MSVPQVQGYALPSDGSVPMGVPADPMASYVPVKVDPKALERHGWPPGLVKMVAESIPSLPIRFVIVDNSGSMQCNDGAKLVPGPGGTLKSISATRWAELGQCLNELADVAMAVGAPTHFHMLNPTPRGQFFAVGDEFAPPGGFVAALGAPRSTTADLRAALETSPNSTTPLTEAVERVYNLIAPHAHMLQQTGQKAVVVISTDGLPNNKSTFVSALTQLQNLPVWMVVRLCTDDDSVVDYYSDLDRQLEKPLETLDDLVSEAKEVAKVNRWLSYGPALHSARMFGLQDRLFDLLDEKALLPSQAKELTERLLGCDHLPEPEVDPSAFKKALEAALKSSRPTYNPITKKMAPWVSSSTILAKGGGCSVQ